MRPVSDHGARAASGGATIDRVASDQAMSGQAMSGRAMSGQAMIDRYVDGLAAALRGPRRMRLDMIAEARDSLLDAADAHRSAGLRPDEAARRAVAEFGAYADVVPGYQAELAVAQGRRTALLLALALPTLHLLAPLMWWRAPWDDSHQPIAGYYDLAAHFDFLSLGASGVAALVLLGFGWGSRYVRDGVRYSRAVGIGALGFLMVHGAAGTAIFGASLYQWPSAATWPPMVVGGALMGAGFVYATATAWRCVVAAAPARKIRAVSRF